MWLTEREKKLIKTYKSILEKRPELGDKYFRTLIRIGIILQKSSVDPRNYL